MQPAAGAVLPPLASSSFDHHERNRCTCPAVALVYNAERANALAGRHWERFASQNYFDKHGVFTGAFVGAPLLFIMFVILVRLWRPRKFMNSHEKRTGMLARNWPLLFIVSVILASQSHHLCVFLKMPSMHLGYMQHAACSPAG